MNKLLGFGLLFAVLVLVSVSTVTVKKASAIYFGNGACPSGEARDYLGICFPIKECKSSFFARPGSCSVAPEAPKGGGTYTVTAPKYKGSPVYSGENEHSLKNLAKQVPNATKNLLNGMYSGGRGGDTGRCHDLMGKPIPNCNPSDS